MHYCPYQIFKDFQSLIAGIIGFTGVILTLCINARIGRKNIQNGIEHERNTLKNALNAELELTLTYFHELAKTSGADGEKISAFYPEEIPHLVYKTFISKIGLLSSEQASAVIKAYALINELPIRLRLLSTGHDPSFDKKGYIFIPEEYEEAALGIYKNCIPLIEHALESLKNKAAKKR